MSPSAYKFRNGFTVKIRLTNILWRHGLLDRSSPNFCQTQTVHRCCRCFHRRCDTPIRFGMPVRRTKVGGTISPIQSQNWLP